MKPGDIVICTDARLSEGRLKEGWRYVVADLEPENCPYNNLHPSIPDSPGIRLIGIDVSKPLEYWKSYRFRPLERKEIEDKVNSVIADKILAKLAKGE